MTTRRESGSAASTASAATPIYGVDGEALLKGRQYRSPTAVVGGRPVNHHEGRSFPAAPVGQGRAAFGRDGTCGYFLHLFPLSPCRDPPRYPFSDRSQGGSVYLLCSHLSTPPPVPFVGTRRQRVLAERFLFRQTSRSGPPEVDGPDGCSRPAVPRIRGAVSSARSRPWRTSRAPFASSLLSWT